MRRGPGAAVSADDAAVTLSVLDGGLRVVTESVPGSRSVSVGVWVGVGSVDEQPSLAGASHYLEHLLFKGTRNRTGPEIAALMDAVGGEFNAFTSHEYTCYYAHVLAEQTELAVDVVCDVVLDATITTADVEMERSVILEEIAMRDDDPEDLLADAFSEGVYAGHPVAAPVIGSTDSVAGMQRSQVVGYYRRRYAPEKMVVALAGDVDHRAVVRMVKKAFGGRLSGAVRPQPPRSSMGIARPDRRIRLVSKDSEQAHLMVGGLGLGREDPRRYTLAVLSTALGGGMSSRLFRSIREERGLAYSCYATSHSYADVGAFSIYAGCHPKNLGDVAAVIRSELADLVSDGLLDDEVQRAKGQLTGSLVLGLDDTESRMSRIGRSVLTRSTFVPVDADLRALESVRTDQVNALAAELLAAPLSAAVVGPYRRRTDLPDQVIGLATGPRGGMSTTRGSGRGRRAARTVRPGTGRS